MNFEDMSHQVNEILEHQHGKSQKGNESLTNPIIHHPVYSCNLVARINSDSEVLIEAKF